MGISLPRFVETNRVPASRHDSIAGNMPPVCVGSLFAFGNQLSIDVELAATLVGFAGTLTGRVTTASPELTVLATN